MLRDRQHGQCMAAEGLFYSKPGGTADNIISVLGFLAQGVFLH